MQGDSSPDQQIYVQTLYRAYPLGHELMDFRVSHKASCVQCGWRWVFESYSEATLHKMAAYHQARNVGHEIKFTKKDMLCPACVNKTKYEGCPTCSACQGSGLLTEQPEHDPEA